MVHQNLKANIIHIFRFRSCSIDGFFSKLQRSSDDETKGYCVNKMGEALGYNGTYANMDCECATVESRINGWGQKPACTSDGSYIKKQCKAGKCYCVDK